MVYRAAFGWTEIQKYEFSYRQKENYLANRTMDGSSVFEEIEATSLCSLSGLATIIGRFGRSFDGIKVN